MPTAIYMNNVRNGIVTGSSVSVAVIRRTKNTQCAVIDIYIYTYFVGGCVCVYAHDSCDENEKHVGSLFVQFLDVERPREKKNKYPTHNVHGHGKNCFCFLFVCISARES